MQKKRKGVKSRWILIAVIIAVLVLLSLFLYFGYLKNFNSKESTSSESSEGAVNSMGNLFSFNWLFNAGLPVVKTCTKQSQCGDMSYCDVKTKKCKDFVKYKDNCNPDLLDECGNKINPCKVCMTCQDNPNSKSNADKHVCSDVNITADKRCSAGANIGKCDGGDCQLCGNPVADKNGKTTVSNSLCKNPCYDKIGNPKLDCSASCYDIINKKGDCKTDYDKKDPESLVNTWCDYTKIQKSNGVTCTPSGGGAGKCYDGFCYSIQTMISCLTKDKQGKAGSICSKCSKPGSKETYCCTKNQVFNKATGKCSEKDNSKCPEKCTIQSTFECPAVYSTDLSQCDKGSVYTIDDSNAWY